MMFVCNIIELMSGYWNIIANTAWTCCYYGDQGVDYVMLLLVWE